MNIFLKVLMAPLLVLALFGSTLYFGLLRPGAVDHIVMNLTDNDTVRTQLAGSFVDTIINDESDVIAVLIKKNKEVVVSVVAEVLAGEEQRKELAATAQQFMNGLLAGQTTVTVDVRPVFRPLYAGIQEILPSLDSQEIEDLEPMVLGEDEPLPDLGILRTIALTLTFAWVLWLLVVGILFRRVGKRAWHTVGWHALTIGVMSVLVVVAVPRVISSLISDATGKALAQTMLTSVSAAGLWLGLVLAIAGVVLVVRSRRTQSPLRESVLASEGATNSQ